MAQKLLCQKFRYYYYALERKHTGKTINFLSVLSCFFACVPFDFLKIVYWFQNQGQNKYKMCFSYFSRQKSVVSYFGQKQKISTLTTCMFFALIRLEFRQDEEYLKLLTEFTKMRLNHTGQRPPDNLTVRDKYCQIK